jgi:hypothetical protein
MAGWYTARRGHFVKQVDSQALFSFLDKGDFDFGNPGHHGTPNERGQAFMIGYSYADETDAAIVYSKGLGMMAYLMGGQR